MEWALSQVQWQHLIKAWTEGTLALSLVSESKRPTAAWPSRKAVGLQMEPREHAGRSPQQSAKCLQETEGELGHPIRDNVSGEAMQVENMV